jgi:cytochrome c peroxidase
VLFFAVGAAPRHEVRLLPEVTSVVPLPPGYLPPPAPESNPLTAEKIELGRHLFYEKQLSANGTQSCGSCHQQQFAFCDGRAQAIGSTGAKHHRNTMTLVNVGYRKPLTWSDAGITTLEQQVLVPLTNEHPVEMGMAHRLDELPRRLANEEKYRRMFATAYPNERAPITVENIARAIASFERSIVSAESPYDRVVRYGDSGALSPEAWRGFKVFFSQRAGCAACHGGPDFATPVKGAVFRSNGFSDRRERFRVASLRNVALTAPYMHDGSVATLGDVVDRYAKVRKFDVTADERQDLVAFLESLTDQSVTTNPRFSAPAQEWAVDAAHSDVSFRVRHLISHVRGRFTRFSGIITQRDPVETSSVAFSIEADSIDTNEPERDDDLRGEDFFDVEKFAQLTFQSTAIKATAKDRYDVTGDLTIHGVTKRVTLPVTFLGTANDPFSGKKVAFETTFTVLRSDYGIQWNRALDNGGVLVGDEVNVTIAIEALEKKKGS